MDGWKSFVSAVGEARIIAGLGALELVMAASRVILWKQGSPLIHVVATDLLIILPGIVLLYGGYRLPDLDLHPNVYPQIVSRCFAGIGMMLGVVGVLAISTGLNRPVFTPMAGTALGSVAGFAIGLNEARALSRAYEAEQAQKELKKTIEHLEASNDRLEQFAYAASHDLQEPLRMVSSYLELLKSRYRDELDRDAEEFIDFATDGADRMRAMIQSLLEYSRVTTDGEPLEPTDAEDVLEDVLNDLALRIEETEATVTTDELPTVTADPAQLAQVFRNLLLNALKYSGDEPPQVHVTVDRLADTWRFSVADEGIGIDPKYHDRTFTVFKQLHAAENPSETEAAGIGLALCERIVERHGGEIWVESDPGEGATFYFTLPRSETQQSEPPAHVLSAEQ
ncbi:histidine kinase (plasmid) [Halorarum halophilum]|uniref:histidine kinase n=1 Tax=Halorarum halophilum TaxID=2743090 RepID=A0A7D5KGJ0_9EURY|nr:ATP-binding protein [Halobaculum halophilum]QLG29837.1 histidine kinase [Halobaculum halophilum]